MSLSIKPRRFRTIGSVLTGAARRRASFAAEPLERRRLLAAVAWDGGGAADNWNDPLNWSTNLVPTVADDVTISVADNPTVLVTDARSVNSLTSDEALTISSTLTIAAASTFNSTVALN